jgi:hypothetical protein
VSAKAKFCSECAAPVMASTTAAEYKDQSLSDMGAKMTNTGAARYALDQIDRARALV